MLDDRNAGPEQKRLCRPFSIGGVIDVDRVDPDECRTTVGKPGSSSVGQKAGLAGVGRRSEPGVVPGVQEDSLAADVKGRQRAYVNTALARAGHPREYGRYIDGLS